MRMGDNNDPLEVIKLQAFLKTFEHFDYVTINGVFDQATFQAVSEFQLRYKEDVLTPWGISAPTGYAYIRTVGKINQILCGNGIPNVYPDYQQVIKDKAPNPIPVVGQNLNSEPLVERDDPDTGLAVALFSWPDSVLNTFQCLYELLLILIVLYIFGNVLENVLYKDKGEFVLKRFYTKWTTMAVGLVVAFILAYVLKEFCLLLPLFIAFVVVLVRLFLPPQKPQEMRIITTEK